MAPKTTVLPLDDNGSNTGSPRRTRTAMTTFRALRPPIGRTGNNEIGRSGRSRTFIFLVNSEAHCLYATDRKKASDLRPEALLQKVLKKVRLHGATLTRLDRDRHGLGKIANCSQMFHIEYGCCQITNQVSTTKAPVRERLTLADQFIIIINNSYTAFRYPGSSRPARSLR